MRFIVIAAAALLLLIPAVPAGAAKAPAATAQKGKMAASHAKKKPAVKKPAEPVQYLRAAPSK